jgi:hypothetical protein
MKAAITLKSGDPGVIKLQETDIPALKDGWVLIKGYLAEIEFDTPIPFLVRVSSTVSHSPSTNVMVPSQ